MMLSPDEENVTPQRCFPRPKKSKFLVIEFLPSTFKDQYENDAKDTGMADRRKTCTDAMDVESRSTLGIIRAFDNVHKFMEATDDEEKKICMMQQWASYKQIYNDYLYNFEHIHDSAAALASRLIRNIFNDCNAQIFKHLSPHAKGPSYAL